MKSHRKHLSQAANDNLPSIRKTFENEAKEKQIFKSEFKREGSLEENYENINAAIPMGRLLNSLNKKHTQSTGTLKVLDRKLHKK